MRNTSPIEREEGTRLMRSLLFPSPRPDECRFLLQAEFNGYKLYKKIKYWLNDTISNEDFYINEYGDIEFRNQEDMNLFMLCWSGKIEFQISVNEPK